MKNMIIKIQGNDNSDFMTYEERNLYEQAWATINTINENVRLKKENLYLQKKLKEHENRIDEQLKGNIQWAGNMLGTLLNATEKIK